MDEIRMRSVQLQWLPDYRDATAFAAVSRTDDRHGLGRMTVCSLQEYHRHLCM